MLELESVIEQKLIIQLAFGWNKSGTYCKW